jgi:hypothetical protein
MISSTVGSVNTYGLRVIPAIYCFCWLILIESAVAVPTGAVVLLLVIFFLSEQEQARMASMKDVMIIFFIK